MSRTCLAQIAHLLTQTLAPPPPPPPAPPHTALLVPFPPKQARKALYSDRAVDIAFDLSHVSGAAHREARWKAIADLTRTRPGVRTQGGEERGEVGGVDDGGDGTSWEKRVEGVDGWDVGWEKCTMMFVKRKGRGVFRFERAVMEG